MKVEKLQRDADALGIVTPAQGQQLAAQAGEGGGEEDGCVLPVGGGADERIYVLVAADVVVA